MYPEGKPEARIEGIEFIKLNVAWQTGVKSLLVRKMSSKAKPG